MKSFLDFFCLCFEISIWNLVYTSSRQLYRSFRFGTHTYIASVLNCTAFHHGWAIFGPLVATNTWKGLSQQSSPPPESFLSFFSTYFEIQTWNLVYTSGRWHDTSRLSFITNRSLPLERSPDFFTRGPFGLRVLSSPVSVCVCICVCVSTFACPSDNSSHIPARITWFGQKDAKHFA